MLAYSSIAHAGYLLVGLVAANDGRQGRDPVLPRRLRASRTSAPSACWPRSSTTGSAARRRPRLRRPLATSRPGLAALLTVFLLSLGGFPPTVGFVAKWYIFNAAVQEGSIALAILGVLTSVVSVFFYLRIVVLMYMTEGAGGRGVRPRSGHGARGARDRRWPAVIYLGVLPAQVLDLARNSIATIF